MMTSLYMKRRRLSSNGTSEWHMHQTLNDRPVFEPDVLKIVDTRGSSGRYRPQLRKPYAAVGSVTHWIDHWRTFCTLT